MHAELGRSFVEALERKDAARLKELLHSSIDFRALTPNSFWQATTADELVDEILLGKWFSPRDVITGSSGIEASSVGSRQRLGYRLSVQNAAGDHVVEQQAYLETDGQRITWLRVLCAGYQPAG